MLFFKAVWLSWLNKHLFLNEFDTDLTSIFDQLVRPNRESDSSYP